jgi:hypothetical protein
MCKHCVCLWSEKTTVCRIFSCQRALLVGGQAPKPPNPIREPSPPNSLTRGAPKARSVRSSGSDLATLKSQESVYVGGRLGALLILQRSLQALSPQQPNNGADVGCSEPEGPATRRNSFVKEPRLRFQLRRTSTDSLRRRESVVGRNRLKLFIRPAFASGWLASPKPRSSYGAAKAGGEYRARTGDLLVANQALSQLS